MSASISLLRSRRKAVENLDDSGEESDCSIKDVKKKESIEKDARAIAAINMLTVSMVNQLLEQQGLDPFGKTLGSPSLDDGQSWTTPMRTTSRPSITRSIKENTFGKKSRKSVRFTPDTNRNECAPDRSCEGDNMDLIHTRTVPLSSLKSEPKFTPIRRSKALKAGMLRSLENELDTESVDNFICSSDSFDSPLPIRNLTGSNEAQTESMDDTPLSPVFEVKSDSGERLTCNQEVVAASSGDNEKASKQSTSRLSCEKSLSDGDTSVTVSKSEQTVDNDKSLDKSEDQSDKNDVPCETPVKPKWTHHFDPTSPEHMSPFLKTLLEERAERSQGKELSKSSSLTEDAEDQQKRSILKGVTAFVEVIRADEDRSSGFRWKLKQLGAQVEENFTKKVTHVVFQEGLLSTYRKAKESNVHLVSAFWVMACDESGSRVPEDKYPIDEEDKYSTLAPLKKYIRRPKLLSPSLGDGDDEKRLARRLQAIKRRSMKIEGAPSVDSDTSDNNVAHSSKTATDSKTPQTSRRAAAAKKSGGAVSGGSSSLMNAWLTGKNRVNSEKDKGKTQGSPLASETVTSKVLTSSPRKKRAAEDSSVKLKTNSFDSPAKKSRLRSPDSLAKTKPSSPARMKRSYTTVDSPDKKGLRSELFDSPSKKKPCTRTVDSPAKTKLSSKYIDSPAKGKSSCKSTDPPAKTNPSSRSTHTRTKTTSSFAGLVDSPAKTKSSSGKVDSPAKAKTSYKSIGSPVKGKSSSKSIDSPAKLKSSSRSFDSPAKLKPSSRSFDSPAKTKRRSRSPDSLAKTKPSSKLTDPTNSTHVASSVRSKSRYESFDSPRVKKRGSDKARHSPVKSTSLRARGSATSEVSGRVLRSTPKKSDSPLSSTMSCTTEEGKMPQIRSSSTSTRDKSLPDCVSANKAFPAKRSLSKTFTDLAETPAKSSITDVALTLTSISADDSKPQDFETPLKKARMDLTCPKLVTEDEEKKLSRGTCPKNAASSRPLKTQKAASSRPKSTKKKTSPRGNAAKSKCNDKNQTIMTSHFRPLVIGKRENVVTNEDFRKVPDDQNVPTASSEDSMQTKYPQISQERDAVLPVVCSSLFVNTCDGIDNERQFSCPLADETKSLFSEEIEIFSGKVEDRQRSCAVNEELRMTSDGREKPGTTADSCVDVGDETKKGSVVFDEKAATDVWEEPPTTDTLEGSMTSVDISEEPREIGDVCGVQIATANAEDESLKASYDCQDKLDTGDVLEVPVEATGVCEEQTVTIDVKEELIETLDFCEDKSASEDAVEESVKTTLVNEEQTGAAGSQESMKATDVYEEKSVSLDAMEEPVKTTLESEEQTDAAGSQESMKATDVYEEKSVSLGAMEELVKTTLESEEQTDAAGSQESMKTTDVYEEKSVSLDAMEEPVKTTLVIEERTAMADSKKESMEATDVCEETLVTNDSCDEPVKTVDCLSEELIVSTDAQEESANVIVREATLTNVFEEPANTSDVCKEQNTVSDAQEESIEASDVCEDNLVDALKEPVLTSDIQEEQAATAAAFEEPVETSDASQKKRAFDDREQCINTSEMCNDQTADVLEERLKTTDLCEELTAASNILEEQPITTDVLPDKSSVNYLSNVEDGSCDSFSSQGLTSNETCRKRSRQNIKPVNKPCHYRTRRSMRFVTNEVAD